MGSRTDLPYLGVAMMEEFDELEASSEISSCCDIMDSFSLYLLEFSGHSKSKKE